MSDAAGHDGPMWSSDAVELSAMPVRVGARDVRLVRRLHVDLMRCAAVGRERQER
jgi:hypothetical protein